MASLPPPAPDAFLDAIVRSCESQCDVTLHGIALKDEASGEAIAAALERNAQITSFSVISLIASSSILCTILHALRKCETLEKLEISRVLLRAAESVEVVELMRALPRLKMLDLGASYIDDGFGAAVAEGLKHTQSLRQLSFCSTHIGNATASVLGDVLKTNTSLEVLSLERTAVGPVGALALASGIAKHPAMLKLNLDRCAIGYEGACAVAEGYVRSAGMKNIELGVYFWRTTIEVLKRRDIVQRVFALLSAADSDSGAATPSAFVRFMRRDGDHAIVCRLAQMLVLAKPPPWT